MLNSIQIDGFRSLNGFKLDLKPGLNVLVGPNGSGKTNILRALDLIANSTHLDNLSYKKTLGGIEISKLFDIYKEDKNITISVLGETETSLISNGSDENTPDRLANLSYEFEFEIGYPPNNGNRLIFTYQRLKLQLYVDNRHHNFEAEYKDEMFSIKPPDEIYLEHMLKNVANGITIDTVRAFIENIHNHSNFLEYRSIVYEMSVVFEPLKAVLQELESLRLYEFDPVSIRNNFEIAGDPKISCDGSGVQNVLRELCEEVRDLEPVKVDPLEKFRGNRGIYNAIITYLKIFLTDISNLDVYQNERNLKIVGEVTFKDGSILPIERLSEGSLKMLTIITILFTTKNFNLLEEPENFLHPSMQQLFVELMRENIDSKESVMIFSTHCETIIDMLEPEEMVMTKFQNGKTTAGRFKDPETLRNKIFESGLGLGEVYITQALDYKALV